MKKRSNKYLLFLILLIIYLSITSAGLIYIDFWMYGRLTFLGYLGIALIFLMLSFWADPLLKIITMKLDLTESTLSAAFLSLTPLPPFIRSNNFVIPLDDLKKADYRDDKRGHQLTLDFVTAGKTHYSVRPPFSQEAEGWLKEHPGMTLAHMDLFFGSHADDTETLLCRLRALKPDLPLSITLSKENALKLTEELRELCNRPKPVPPRRRRRRS